MRKLANTAKSIPSTKLHVPQHPHNCVCILENPNPNANPNPNQVMGSCPNSNPNPKAIQLAKYCKVVIGAGIA